MNAPFVLLAAAMVVAALAFLLVPLLRHRRAAGGTAAAARRLRALDEALAAGVIDSAEHARKRATIVAEEGSTATPHASRLVLASILAVALLLPAATIVLYRLVGTPQALDAAAASPSAGGDGPSMEQAVAGLAARLEKEPDDVEGWLLLARAYQAMEKPVEALDAVRRAHALAPDEHAITVEYAQALALNAEDHGIRGEARELLEGVIAKEPTNQRALWLLGISDYQQGRYQSAIDRWNALLPLLEPGSEVANGVQRQIADAQGRLAAPTRPESGVAAAPQTAQAAPVSTTPEASGATESPKLTVRVDLDPALAGRLDPDATLFVFARAANGPPMPLSIERRKASELPLTVVLDDGKGMLPNMKLSMFPQVVVGARVSKSGQAIAQSGDLQALSEPVDVNRKEPVELSIDEVVP